MYRRRHRAAIRLAKPKDKPLLDMWTTGMEAWDDIWTGGMEASDNGAGSVIIKVEVQAVGKGNREICGKWNWEG